MSKELYEARAKAVADAREILDRAEREKRDLTSDETGRYERIDAEIDRLNDQLAKSEQKAAAKSRPVRAAPAALGGDGAALSIGYEGYSIPSVLKGRSPRENVFKPGSPEHLRSQPRYKEAFLRYLTTGREQLGLQVGKDNKGGFLAPIEFVADLIKFVDNNVFMRQLATVLPPMPNAVNLGVPSWDTDPNDADWTAEVPASDISEDTAAALGKREFMPHLLTKLVKISNKLMRTSVINPEGLLRDRLGYKFAITEEQAFITGTGAQQPLGCMVASANGVSTSRDITATNTTSFVADDIINLLYNLKEQYQRNATGLFSRTAIKMMRKLKDGAGQYLWQPGLTGQPNTILDRPYVMSEYCPSTFTTGLYVGMFADFKAGYWIADSLNLEIQVLDQLFALKNQTGLIARKETDGAPVLEEAFSRLILA